MSLPRLWVVDNELIHASQLGDMHVEGVIELVNGQDVWDRKTEFYSDCLLSKGRLGPWPDPWPTDFPKPHIRLDDPGYATDLFRLENWWFVSRRLLIALQLSPDDADLLATTFTGNCPAARTAGYHLMRIRRFTDIIDFDASDCDWEWRTATTNGQRYRHVSWIGRIRFRSDVTLSLRLFQDFDSFKPFATDALAVRVLAAGCTGIEFVHPLWFNEVGIKVVRSATGVEKHIYADDERSFETIPMTWEEADAGPNTSPTTGIADYIRPVPSA